MCFLILIHCVFTKARAGLIYREDGHKEQRELDSQVSLWMYLKREREAFLSITPEHNQFTPTKCTVALLSFPPSLAPPHTHFNKNANMKRAVRWEEEGNISQPQCHTNDGWNHIISSWVYTCVHLMMCVEWHLPNTWCLD